MSPAVRVYLDAPLSQLRGVAPLREELRPGVLHIVQVRVPIASCDDGVCPVPVPEFLHNRLHGIDLVLPPVLLVVPRCGEVRSSVMVSPENLTVTECQKCPPLFDDACLELIA